MRKINLKYALLACGLTIFHTSSASSFLSGFDPITPPGAVVNFVAEGKNIVESVKHLTELEMVTGSLSMFDKLKDTSKGLGKNAGTSSGLKIEACDGVDIYDVASIQTKLNKLFLEVPSVEILYSNQYREKSQEFYEDSIVEIYTSSVLLEEELNTVIEKEIAEIKKSIKEGGDGLKKPDDGFNSVSLSQSRAIKTIDEVLRILQEAMALQIQLDSAKFIAEDAKPFYVPDDSIKSSYDTKKQSSLMLDNKIYASAKVSESNPLAFAQMFNVEVNDEAIAKENEKQEETSAVIVKKVAKSAELNSPFFKVSDSLKRDISHPFVHSADKISQLVKLEDIAENVSFAIEAHNLLQNLDAYKASADNVKRLKEYHKKTLDILKATDKCAVNYFSYFYDNPSVAWAGSPINEMSNNYDLRSGISKEAYLAFSTMKAAEMNGDNGINVKDFNIPSEGVLGIDETKEVSLENSADFEKTLKNQGSSFESPSKETKYQEDARRIEVLPWVVGAGIMQNVANKNQNKIKVWNDVKSFYAQYLNKKYSDKDSAIKNYLNKFDIANIRANVFTSVNLKNLNLVSSSMKNNWVKSIEEADAKLEKGIADAKRVKDIQLANLDEKVKSDIASIDAKINRYNLLMDRSGRIAKEANKNLSDKQNELQESAMEALKNQVKKRDIFEKVILETEIYENPELQMLKDDETKSVRDFEVVTIEKRFYEKDKMEQEEVKTLKERSAEYKKISDSLESGKINAGQVARLVDIENEKIKNYKEAVKTQEEAKLAINSNYEKSKLGIDSQYEEGLKELYLSYDAEKEEANKLFNDELDKKISSYAQMSGAIFTKLELDSILDNIDSAINKSRNAANAIVNDAKNQMDALGEGLYLAENHSKIVEIHKQMIEKLKALNLVVAIAGNNPVKLLAYEKLSREGTAGSVEDVNYYVSLDGNDRDLKAPKKVFKDKYPYVREIVHFDIVDQDNAVPFLGGKALLEGASSYGFDIPEVWKTVLGDKPFVERDFNFKDFFSNEECSAQRYFQGGKLPCALSDKLLLNIKPDGEFYTVQTNIPKNISACYDYSLLSLVTPPNYGDAMSAPIARVFDKKAEAELLAPLDSKTPLFCSNYSELGMLLKAADGKATYSKAVQSTYDNVKKIEKEAEKLKENQNLSKKQQMDLNKYNNALLDKNQVGAFLKSAEQEELARKAAEEVELKNKELVAELVELLSRFGYDAAENIDMANEREFELVRRKLKDIKSSTLLDIDEAISDVDVADNEVVEERVEKFKNVIAALKKDNKELTPITDAVVLDNRVDENIKSAEADAKIVKKHDDLAKDALSKEENNLFTPYCAIYEGL